MRDDFPTEADEFFKLATKIRALDGIDHFARPLLDGAHAVPDC